jgi:hypothetical protein
MSDVRKVFITAETADQLELSDAYVVRLGLQIGLEESEMRKAGKRGYLFSEEAIEKLRAAKGGTARKAFREWKEQKAKTSQISSEDKLAAVDSLRDEGNES